MPNCYHMVMGGENMDWIKIIQNSIDEIEEKLGEDISADTLAQNQFISSFYYQKMFSALCSITVSEYIRNRRLTMAGFDIINTEQSILDIAIKYGYDTNESFTRAFVRFHGVIPSVARKNQSNLHVYSKISLIHSLTGGKTMLGNLGERGYLVKETGAVYYTEDMDKTMDWFKNVLGWYGQIESRDADNTGNYGCVNNLPIEIESLHLAPFTGIHLFKGEPIKRVIGFMLVQGLDELYTYVKSQGWNEITPVITEPWGSKTCMVTTIDGSILKFFE